MSTKTLSGKLGLILFGVICFTGNVMAQSGGVLSTDKSQIPINAATTVTFKLALAANPNVIVTSPNLQRLGGGVWSIVDRLYDDGTHGDLLAGDNIYTLSVSMTEAALGAISFRGSVAYKGSLLRVFSNSLAVNISPALGLLVDSGSDETFVTQGSTQNVVSTVTLSKSGTGAVNVQNVVTIVPSTGLTFTSDYPAGGWASTTSQSFVMNQKFTGVTAGDYLVTNTATIVGQGISAADSVIVHVIPVGGDPVIFPLGASPDAVAVGVPTSVLFTASIASQITSPTQLSLRLVNGAGDPVVGTLRDDGTNGDLSAGDGVFSGFATVNAATAGVVRYRATGVFPGLTGERTSGTYSVTATTLPTSVVPSDMTKAVFDPVSQQRFICNEIVVSFTQPKTDAEIVAFANSFGAVVVGTLPGVGLYQLRISNPNCLPSVTLATLNAMSAVTGVKTAGPNVIGTITEVTPNDPQYAAQYAPQKIRADEAWVIARGGSVIAILDTGVDYNHEDLTGKVILGPDLVNGDADPMDDHGHGTHCAGIAAANGNNGKGVAGIAWASSILAIKVADSGGSITYTNGAASIMKAADLGAKVISCSWGWPPGVFTSLQTWLAGLESAVNYASAKGAIVVVAAGNEGSTAIRLPGAYANSFCVGSTTSSDTRSGFSCFGPEVDIAAPGSTILSTLRGGGYGNLSGTSMATPCVSGAIAVLWSRFPTYTAAQIKNRLIKTAVELPGLQLGAGRVDLFEAVFNGSFEDGTNGWTVAGTAGAVPTLGPLTPTDRKNFGFASSGPDSAVVQTTLEQSFTIQANVTQFKVSFDYNFVTEEYPEWVNQGYNDNMRITLVKPDGTSIQLAFEDVDHSAYTLVGGIDFPGGDNTVGQTGWKGVTTTTPVTVGPGTYRIVVRDEGDGIYDSNVLIDHIRFK